MVIWPQEQERMESPQGGMIRSAWQIAINGLLGELWPAGFGILAP